MFEIIAATTPMKILCGIPTKPAPGVIATRPTTAPIQNPSTEGFFPFITSKNIQESPAAPAAVFVVAVTMKTESLNGFPIVLQNCLQKDLVASRTKLFPVPPDPVKFMTSHPSPPLSNNTCLALSNSEISKVFLIEGSSRCASIKVEQITLNAEACFKSSL